MKTGENSMLGSFSKIIFSASQMVKNTVLRKQPRKNVMHQADLLKIHLSDFNKMV